MLGNQPLRSSVRQRRANTKTTYYALQGGLDVVTPALSIRPGRAIGMVNFEPWYQGGYRRIPGYERFDGSPKPSDATFTGFDVSTVASLTLRDTITGDVSGATGVLVGIWDDDGTYGSDTIGVTKHSGTPFNNGELCNSGAFTVDSAPVTRYAPTVALEETWLLEAEDDYRDDIAVVPGANQVRGVWQVLDEIYAIRDNAGVTAGILHKASATGWTTTGVTMADTLPFTTLAHASSPITEGETITGAISGETATVHRVVLNGGSGAWDAGGGIGYLVFTDASGTFNAAEILRVDGNDMATTTASQTTFALSVGGVYRFHNHNFFGGAATYRAYGCNGVDPAFEIDENSVCTPILMPATAVNAADNQTVEAPTNTPFLVEEHRGHLFLAFEGGSVQHSAPGTPLVFSGFLGAGEFGLGDDITSINSVVGNVLVMSTKRETRGLFGTGVADWELRIIAEQSGSLLFGSKKIDTVYSLDDLGITSVARSDQFGDFINATVSQAVQPIVIAARANFTDSTIVRESNQFRMYFSDNSCLVMYVPAGSQAETRQGSSQQLAEFGFLSYDIPVTQIYNSDDETGKERSYFVTADATFLGYVFEDQIGKNFDGETIASYVRTAFNQVGSPSYRKRFRRADLELSTSQQLALQFAADLTYSTAEVSSGLTSITTSDISEIDVFGSGGFWDDTNWDEFVWDGQAITTARANLSGTGENIGFLIFNDTAKASAWVMQGITLHYDMRRLQR